MRISRGRGGLRASVIIAMTVWPSALKARRLTTAGGPLALLSESVNGNGTTTTSKASQVIEILVIVGGVPLSESRGNRPMPGKVEWLRLAEPNRIPFQFVDQGVAGMDPQFVADFLRKSGLALAGDLAGHRYHHRTLLTSLRQGGHLSLARLVLSRRGIEAEDPSPDFINGCPRAGEHFARLYRWTVQWGRRDSETSRRICSGPRCSPQAVPDWDRVVLPGCPTCQGHVFWEMAIGPDEKVLERLLDRLLAVENGIFGRGRLCRQVDSGVSQIVRRFASPRCRVRQPPGID